MKRHPELTIEKLSGPHRGDDSYGSYRVPGDYSITGPSGRRYHVEGTAAGYYESSRWSYSSEHPNPVYKGGFRNRAECIAAIAALEAQPQPKTDLMESTP